MTKAKQPELTLQAGKTYLTNSGEKVTLSKSSFKPSSFYYFLGSNGLYYGINGSTTEDTNNNSENIASLFNVKK